jgi:hypothetical protein
MRGAREPATSLPSGVACRAIDSHPPAHLLGRCDQAMSRWAHTRHRRRAAAASRTHHAESDFGAVTRDHTFDVLGSLPRDRFFKSPKIDTHLVATAARQRACPRRPPRKKKPRPCSNPPGTLACSMLTKQLSNERPHWPLGCRHQTTKTSKRLPAWYNLCSINDHRPLRHPR